MAERYISRPKAVGEYGSNRRPAAPGSQEPPTHEDLRRVNADRFVTVGLAQLQTPQQKQARFIAKVAQIAYLNRPFDNGGDVSQEAAEEGRVELIEAQVQNKKLKPIEQFKDEIEAYAGDMRRAADGSRTLRQHIGDYTRTLEDAAKTFAEEVYGENPWVKLAPSPTRKQSHRLRNAATAAGVILAVPSLAGGATYALKEAGWQPAVQAWNDATGIFAPKNPGQIEIPGANVTLTPNPTEGTATPTRGAEVLPLDAEQQANLNKLVATQKQWNNGDLHPPTFYYGNKQPVKFGLLQGIQPEGGQASQVYIEGGYKVQVKLPNGQTKTYWILGFALQGDPTQGNSYYSVDVAIADSYFGIQTLTSKEINFVGATWTTYNNPSPDQVDQAMQGLIGRTAIITEPIRTFATDPLTQFEQLLGNEGDINNSDNLLQGVVSNAGNKPPTALTATDLTNLPPIDSFSLLP